MIKLRYGNIKYTSVGHKTMRDTVTICTQEDMILSDMGLVNDGIGIHISVTITISFKLKEK